MDRNAVLFKVNNKDTIFTADLNGDKKVDAQKNVQMELELMETMERNI